MHIPFLTDDPNDTSFPYFWGPIDSLHTFCERKYITHPMAAEFYNCIGSLIYCFAASVGLYHCRGTVWQVQCGWWSLLVVGMGSFLFHVMMRYNAELGDELPMLILVACGILGFDGSHPWAMSMGGQRLLRGWTLSVLVGLIALYLWTRIFGLFISGFTGGVIALIGLGLTSNTQEKGIVSTRMAAIKWICFARVSWETENHGCAMAPWLWPLHNVWHLTSCIACYYMLFHAYYYRIERLGLAGVFGTLAEGATEYPALPRPPGFTAAWHQDMCTRAPTAAELSTRAATPKPSKGGADAVRRSPRFGGIGARDAVE